MQKILEFFKSLPQAYYNWRQRSEKIDKLLNECTSNTTELKRLNSLLDAHSNELRHLKGDMESIIAHLGTVKHGTKMELFETLHNWRQLLVVKRGWATVEEKREVQEIYSIYHDELEGNGNGEIYYNEIIALPESREEMEAIKNVRSST